MDKSEPCLVPFTRHTSAVSHVTGIKIELLDLASARASGSFWSKLLLQKRRGLLILPKKCWKPLYAVCEVLVILIRKLAEVKNAYRASTS